MKDLQTSQVSAEIFETKKPSHVRAILYHDRNNVIAYYPSL